MSTNEQTPLSQLTSVVRNTLGKEQDPQGLGMPASDAALREYRDRNYHQLLSIIAEKVHQEKVQQERLKAVKARLNFEETSQHSESGTQIRRRDLKKRLGSRHARGMSGSPEPSHGLETRGRVHPHTQKIQGVDHTTVAAETLKAATRVLAQEKRSLIPKNIIKIASSRRTKALSKSEGSAGGHWKSRPKRQKSSVEDDLSSHGVWYDDLPKESIDSYDDLKEAFLENYLQQKKCIKDPIEIHNIKQRDGESTKEFVRSWTEAKLQEGRLPEPTKAEAKARQIHTPHKNTKRNSGFGQREVQVSSANDNPGRKKKRWQILRVSWESESGKKGGNLRKGKTVGNIDGEEDGTEGPMIIEAEIGGHFFHRMYVDGGSSSEILYEHCFNRFRPKHHPRPEKMTNGTRRVVRTGPTKLCFKKLAPSVGPEQNARPTRVEHHAG
nr:reverse transcriptase domain-containing protein [Tanacetum cinerariifolium]